MEKCTWPNCWPFPPVAVVLKILPSTSTFMLLSHRDVENRHSSSCKPYSKGFCAKLVASFRFCGKLSLCSSVYHLIFRFFVKWKINQKFSWRTQESEVRQISKHFDLNAYLNGMTYTFCAITDQLTTLTKGGRHITLQVVAGFIRRLSFKALRLTVKTSASNISVEINQWAAPQQFYCYGKRRSVVTAGTK